MEKLDQSKLDNLYHLLYNYLIRKFEDQSANSQDFKAAIEFLKDHKFDFTIDTEAKAEELRQKAQAACAGIEDEEILEALQVI